MLLSICIPSYNRGHRAKMLVKNLLSLPYDDNELEVVLSDNGSRKYADKYMEIADIEDPRFHYYRADENMGFLKNLNQVIRMSKGDYCMIISDEDRVVRENVEVYMEILRTQKELAVVKARNTFQFTEDHDISAAAGDEAIDRYYMKGNYISGTIYNRSILTNDVIDEYESRYAGNTAYRHYPHMLYDAYMTLKGRYIYKNLLLIINGKDQGDMEENTAETGETYIAYQNRMDQMMGFIEQIRDVEAGVGEKFHMFCKVCDKYAYLMWLVHRVIQDSDEELAIVLEECGEKMKDGLRMIELPLGVNETQEVHAYIDSLMNYMDVLERYDCFS